jgi:hypothetical protein
MSAPDSKDASGEVAEGSHAFSNSPEPTDSIWTTPLQQGQIRLFNIELDDSDDIRGTLEIFEHESAPAYIAQSYVCGEGECDFKITVNGNAHYIKPNLSTPLRQTKRAIVGFKAKKGFQPTTYTTLLWIDAICIHQSNIAELEMQIRFMGNIYKGASSTIVSLGELSESHRLISLFADWVLTYLYISRRLPKQGECRSTDDDQARNIEIVLSQQTMHERRLQTDFNISKEALRTIWGKVEYEDVDCSSPALSFGHPFWQACVQLFENDWFTRVWTYQELMLSRNVFVTLHTTVPWQMLQHWPENIISLHANNKSNTTMSKEAKWFYDYVIKRYYQHRSLRKLRADPDSIWKLLLVTAQRRARVPKDHVFAILALLEDETQSLVDVDYSKTDAQVFQGIFELALKTKTAAQTLPSVWKVLSWVPTTTFGLPSWMPELNNDTDARVGQQGSRMLSKAVVDAFWDAAQLRVSHENGVIFLTPWK